MGNTLITEEQWAYINDLVQRGLAEDLGRDGDITSQAIFKESDAATAVFKCKVVGVLAGSYLITPIFKRIDPSVELNGLMDDGSALALGSRICTVAGPVRALLTGERLALNFLQRLSGIATLTRSYGNAIAHTHARLLDTRKTTPGLRILEKMAVVSGGGCNHRFGLFDMMLIKDTHAAACGGPAAALRRARTSALAAGLRIEVEVQSISEYTDVAPLLPFRIMLDNMSLDDMRWCADHRDQNKLPVELEASGKVNLEAIAAIAETGVDFISCGALTHSAPALDIHMFITE